MHSFIIHDREDAAHILEFLFHGHSDLKRLILKCCHLGEDSTGLLAKIVAVYPDLEVLALEGCRPLTFTGYSLIPRLKKLSELNLSHCEVDYMYINILETCVHIHECIQGITPRNSFCMLRQQGDLLHF